MEMSQEMQVAQEFQKMKCFLQEKKVCSKALDPENLCKNRYADVLPYEETRVRLKLEKNDQSDYINANYITDQQLNQRFICCQAPLPTTFDDFWRMIWETNSNLIVMLTNLEEKNRIKAHIYWPFREGESSEYGSLRVTYLKLLAREGINIRQFKIEVQGSSETRTVYQLHYTDWPDMGVPSSTKTMGELIKEVDIRRGKLDQPVVIHCSAGIGRTGTFLAIYINKQKALLKDCRINVMSTVLQLREQRLGMVQSMDQYEFVYTTLKDVLSDRVAHSGSPTSFSFLKNGLCTKSSQKTPTLNVKDDVALCRSSLRSSAGTLKTMQLLEQELKMNTIAYTV